MNHVCILAISIFVGLATFLMLQPKQGKNPHVGFNLKIYDTNNQCYHIHHWMYMGLLIALVMATIVISGGQFNLPITVFVGFLTGASISDYVYCDSCKIKGTCSSK